MPRPVNHTRSRRIAAAWHDGKTLSEIADAEGIGQRWAERIVDRLRKQGIILDYRRAGRRRLTRH